MTETFWLKLQFPPKKWPTFVFSYLVNCLSELGQMMARYDFRRVIRQVSFSNVWTYSNFIPITKRQCRLWSNQKPLIKSQWMLKEYSVLDISNFSVKSMCICKPKYPIPLPIHKFWIPTKNRNKLLFNSSSISVFQNDPFRCSRVIIRKLFKRNKRLRNTYLKRCCQAHKSVSMKCINEKCRYDDFTFYYILVEYFWRYILKCAL